MLHGRSRSHDPVCSNCIEPIDLEWFAEAMRLGLRPIVHGCGRVLHDDLERILERRKEVVRLELAVKRTVGVRRLKRRRSR